MKKILFFFALLLIVAISSLIPIKAVEATGFYMPILPAQSYPVTSLTRSFIVYPANFSCPRIGLEGTDPNVGPWFDTVGPIDVANVYTKLYDPNNNLLTKGTDYAASAVSGQDSDGNPIAIYTLTLNSGSISGIYQLKAAVSQSYTCPYNTSYAATAYANGQFTYQAPVVMPPAPPSSCTASFSPTRIMSGDSSLGSWTQSNDADGQIPFSCTGNLGSGTFSGSSGNILAYPTQSQTCTLTVVNSAGASSTCQANITVTSPPQPPTISSFTASSSPILRSNWATLSWTTTRSDFCQIPEIGYSSQGNNGSASAYIHPANTNDGATVPFTLQCYNSIGDMTQQPLNVIQKYDQVHFKGYSLNSCSDPLSSGVALSQSAANSVSFEAVISTPTETKTFPAAKLSGTPTKPNDYSWGYISNFHPATYTVTGNNMVPPSGYQFCQQSAPLSQTITRTDAAAPWQDTTIKLYFSLPPVSIPPTPNSFGLIPECHQNDPSVSGQVLLGWIKVSEATGYKVYRDGNLLTTISDNNITWYLDQNVTLGSTHSYYVTSYNGAGDSSPTNIISTTVPTNSQCVNNPPPLPPAGWTPTYVITPVQQTINVDDTAQYKGLYDPDGGGGTRYGNFDVTGLASWSLKTPPNIANSLGSGAYKGTASGGKSGNINSSYTPPTSSAIPATATLNVNNPSSPDFTISIAPSITTVTKPGSSNYTITISPLNGFSGNVALTVSGLHAGTSGSPNPVSINTQGNSTLTLTVTSSAANERYTFTVTGTSGSISHDADADLIVQSPGGGNPSCTVTPNPQSGSTPLTTSVSASASGGASPYVYKYDWTSDGVYETNYGNSPQSHTYNSDGTYQITVKVRDANLATATCNTSVNAPPNVCVGSSCGGGGSLSCNLDAVPKFGNAPLGVNFQVSNVTGGNGNYQYKFDYGDSNVDNYPAANPSLHTYTNAGSYTPVASVKEVGGVKTGSCSIPVNPNITVSPPPTSACTFTASPSALLYLQKSTLSWDCNVPPESSCSIDKGIGAVAHTGNTRVSPTQDTSYTITCDGTPNVTASVGVRVGFLPVIREIIPR